MRRAAVALLSLWLLAACEQAPDTVMPSVRLVAPQDGDTLEPGDHELVAAASDDRGVHHLIFWCEGRMLAFLYDPAAETLRCGWDSRAYAGRDVTVGVEVLDRARNDTMHFVRVHVRPAR